MIDAVAPQDLVMTFTASALIVLFGAGYAAFFACSRITGRSRFTIAAGLCYIALACAVMMLSRAAHFDGSWRIVSAFMLLGYLLAPYGIWRLCTASHRTSQDKPEG
jgi:hypothetical protein